jgi:hypothetical protein
VTSLRREIVTAENVPIAIFAYLAGDEHQSFRGDHLVRVGLRTRQIGRIDSL